MRSAGRVGPLLARQLLTGLPSRLALNAELTNVAVKGAVRGAHIPRLVFLVFVL